MAAAGLDLTEESYAHVLQDVGMFGWPRRYASPGRQTPVRDKPLGGTHGSPKEFFDWLIPRFNGRDPDTNDPIALFVGHNKFAVTKDSRGYTVSQDRYAFETAFGDMDTGNGTGLTPQQVEEEVQRTARWHVENGVPHVWKFSGSDGGFHLRSFFTPEDATKNYLARWERAYWNGLRAELNLRSLNMQCAEPTHLERLPYTRRVHKKDPSQPGKYVWDERFCVPIPWEWVYQGRWEEIRKLSKYPRLFEESVRFVAQPVSLENFVISRGWGSFGHVSGSLHPPIDPAMLPTGDVRLSNDLYMGNKECLKTLIFGANPVHRVRLAWAFELLTTGLTEEEALHHCHRVGQAAAAGHGWQDFDPEVSGRHIHQIWNRLPRYEPHGCALLLKEGVCVGERCALYKLAFPDLWQEHLKIHPMDASADRCLTPDMPSSILSYDQEI